MVRGRFWLRILLTLLVVGLLVAAGAGLYRLGFVQGYQAAALNAGPAANGAPNLNPGNPTLPYFYGPYPYFYRGFGFPWFFPPFGLFFGIGLFFLVFVLFGGLFRMWGWRAKAEGGRMKDEEQGNYGAEE